MKTFYLSNYNFSKEMENTLNEFFTKSFEKVIPLASLPLKKIYGDLHMIHLSKTKKHSMKKFT